MEATGSRVVYYKNKDAELSIWNVADIHLLNRGMSMAHLLKDRDRIKTDPYSMFLIDGDYADWIYPHDPRFDPSAYDPDVRVIDLADLGALIARNILDIFTPIANKCLGVGMGNHEYKAISRNSRLNVHSEICDMLGVPNLMYSGLFDIYFIHRPKMKDVCTIHCLPIAPKEYTAKLRVFTHHGAGAANTAGGKINRLVSFVNMVEADLVLMGHVHEQFAKAFLRLTANDNCSEITQKITMGLITGSYLRTYAEGFVGYGEMKGYHPTTLGASKAKYIPSTMELIVESKGEGVGKRGTIE